MADIFPFRALRPEPATAAQVAAVPYDVVTTEEARALADGNPLSFLRVSRAEIELAPDVDPYAVAVYERAAANFARLREATLVTEAQASVYCYRLRMNDHEQTGVAACYSLDEYDRDVIKKHERTRRDKEDDRTRHMLALGAQTGPVFLTYRASQSVGAITSRVTAADPLFDFEAPDGVHHSIWRATPMASDALIGAFRSIPALYIADGHHRAASAARARLADQGTNGGRPPKDAGERDTFLAVAFPHDQMQILPYNRIVKDLAGLTPDRFVAAVRESFHVAPGPAAPVRRGQMSMYVGREWYVLEPLNAPDPSDPIASMDVSVLQDRILGPILKIADVRTDKRIDFIGGVRGAAVLQEAVDAGRALAAFSMFPASVADLMAVSDAGAIMPPKSTWFEPKLRDGLLIHLI